MVKNFTIFCLFFLFCIPLFCQTQTCLQNLDHPNYHSIEQLTSTETIVREYILHIPSTYNAETATPLVINLHGFGDCAADYYETVGAFYELNQLADQENFIVAYPQGAYRPEKEETYWEPGDDGSTNIYENDVYFMEQLISNIDEEYNLDLNNVFICGYSNGGMMAYSMACNSSDRIAGIGIMSGTMLDEVCNIDNSIPIVVFHGIGDGVLPYEGNIWYQSVADVVNFWLDQNDIPSSSLITSSLNNGNVEKNEYFGENANTCLTLYTIYEEWDKPGDHVWFSEEIEGRTPNQIMWDFFEGNCSPISATAEQVNSYLSFNVQPNPFSNQITINTANTSIQHYSIYNLQGKLLRSGKLNAHQNTIDLSALPANVYILNVGHSIQKIVKID